MVFDNGYRREVTKMTVRVYLAAARIIAEPARSGDIPVERLFVHASDLPELWIETESLSVPSPGRSVSFCLAGEVDFGVNRIVGTVERIVSKESRARVRQ
jgi:hypothetical protein